MNYVIIFLLIGMCASAALGILHLVQYYFKKKDVTISGYTVEQHRNYAILAAIVFCALGALAAVAKDLL